MKYNQRKSFCSTKFYIMLWKLPLYHTYHIQKEKCFDSMLYVKIATTGKRKEVRNTLKNPTEFRIHINTICTNYKILFSTNIRYKIYFQYQTEDGRKVCFASFIEINLCLSIGKSQGIGQTRTEITMRTLEIFHHVASILSQNDLVETRLFCI